jgi:hypothetical protein
MSSRDVFVIVGFLTIFINGCIPDEKSREITPISGMEQMRDSIDSIFSTMNPAFAIYDNEKRAEFLAQRIRENQTTALIFDFAKEKLNAGDTETSISIIENILNNNPQLNTVNASTIILHEFLGICYLRLAEQKNCQNFHSAESCIVPLQGGGVHRDKSPAQRAKEVYLGILGFRPNDLETRWLLNITYMALGEYPDEVPEEYFIELPNNGQKAPMENIAGSLGVDVNDLSGSVIADDFTNNGYLDLMVSSWGRNGSIKFFVNQGPAGFEDKTTESNLHLTYGGLNIKQADFNNDGWMDFIVLRGAWKPNLDWGIPPNSLLRNNGDGTFSDVTIGSGLYSQRPSQSAVWLDYDLDGLIDLFIANETTKSSGMNFPCQLFRNNGDETFTDVATELKVDYVGYFKGVVAGDINNDGRQDVFLSNLDGNNVLLENKLDKGKVVFKDISKEAGIQLPQSAFPAWFFDFDQDGFEDLYIATFDSTAFNNQSGEFAASLLGEKVNCEPNYLYRNKGDGTFQNVAPDYFDYHALSTMGCNYGDLNNSGFPDFYLGTGAPDYRSTVPNRLFINENGRRFTDATFATQTGHVQKGHGICFADFNHNGRQDIYAVMGGAFSGDVFHNALYENTESKGQWLKIKLKGEQANSVGLGAKISVAGRDKNQNLIKRYVTISSGASFGGNPLEAHVGLGDMAQIDSLTVRGPNSDDLNEQYFDLKVNHRYLISEDGTFEDLPLQPFDYPQNSNHQHHH